MHSCCMGAICSQLDIPVFKKQLVIISALTCMLNDSPCTAKMSFGIPP